LAARLLSGALLDPSRSAGKCADFETIILDFARDSAAAGQPADCPPCDGRAQIGADPAEKVKTRRLGRACGGRGLDLLGDRHHVDSVGVIQRTA